VTVAERAVAPAALRHEAGAVLAGGGTVDALFAAGPLGAREVRYVCATGAGELIIRCAADEGVVPTLVDRLPHLAWDEREAHDLYGIDFAGHRPLRPLVHHPRALDAWTTPVAGDDVHQVAVGPVHAGIIESGHFRFHAVGERVIHLDARLFHKHRDLERLAEGRGLAEMIEVLRHACGACAVANAVAGAHAAEQAAGLWPGPELSRVRTLLLELERLYNHLNDIGQICAGVGLAPGAMAFAALKERAQRINLALTGHRFLFGTVAFAGSELAVTHDEAARARHRLRELAADTRAAGGDLSRDPSLRDRTRGAGVLTRADALALAVRGPAARASGVAIDARSRSPRLDHEGFAPAAGGGEGDVAARLEIRALELDAVFAMLDRLLDGAVAACATVAAGPAAGHGVGRVEGPRGESLCVVEAEGGVVRRVHLRTASFANWPAVTVAVAGTILPDFPLINKSFELCYACVDR
jgi:Ni,Fe-hydrogenase III large subunit